MESFEETLERRKGTECKGVVDEVSKIIKGGIPRFTRHNILNAVGEKIKETYGSNSEQYRNFEDKRVTPKTGDLFPEPEEYEPIMGTDVDLKAAETYAQGLTDKKIHLNNLVNGGAPLKANRFKYATVGEYEDVYNRVNALAKKITNGEYDMDAFIPKTNPIEAPPRFFDIKDTEDADERKEYEAYVNAGKVVDDWLTRTHPAEVRKLIDSMGLKGGDVRGLRLKMINNWAKSEIGRKLDFNKIESHMNKLIEEKNEDEYWFNRMLDEPDVPHRLLRMKKPTGMDLGKYANDGKESPDMESE